MGVRLSRQTPTTRQRHPAPRPRSFVPFQLGERSVDRLGPAMLSRIGRHGPVTRALHWLTVLVIGVQFTIGYLMDPDGQGRGRGRGRGGESGRGRGRGGDLDVLGDDTLVTVHVVLGLSILLLAALRLWWRRRSALAPWPPQLSSTGRIVEHRVEVAFYVLLFLIPLSGLWLVLVDDDAVIVHVGAHLAFFVVAAVHVGLVLQHRLLRRML